MNVKNIVATVATLSIIVIISACGSGDSPAADSGPTMAQFNALVKRVAGLESQVNSQADTIAELRTELSSVAKEAGVAADLYLAISAPNLTPEVHAAHLQRRAMLAPAAGTAPNPCTDLGTLTGSPKDANPASSKLLSGISCTGYLYVIESALAGQQAELYHQPAPVRIMFTGPDCTGDAYYGGLAPPAAVVNGFVFRQETQGEVENPSFYWYLPAGEEKTLNVVAPSYWTRLGCSHFTGTVFPQNMYRLHHNDPSVTGIDSAPIPGPVLIAQPGQ